MPLVQAACVLALLCYTFLVLLVVRRARRQKVARQFLCYLLAMLTWQASQTLVAFTSDPQVALFGYRMVLAFAGSFGFYYALFVRDLLGITAGRILVRIGYAGTIALPLYLLAGGPGMVDGVYQEPGWPLYLPEVGTLALFVGAQAYFFLGYALFHLIRIHRQTTSTAERNRLTYLIIGVPVVILGTAVNYLPAVRGYPVDILAHVLNAFLTAVAILRYRLLDIQLVVRKGLRYSVTTVTISGIYFLLVSLAVQVFHLVSNVEVLLLSVLMAMLAAVLVQPLRDELQSRVDRQFFREKYDAARMLQRLSQSSAALLDVEELAAMILREVSETMHVERGAFFVLDQDGNYRMVATEGLPPDRRYALCADNPVVAYLAAHQTVFWAANLARVPLLQGLRLEERAAWDQLQPELLIPISVKQTLVGLLAVGPRKAGVEYSTEDRVMLMTLANQTAVAIENARLYAAVQAELAERERAEARLLESLYEKEVLLKEIHHRVKNNLQVIYSLLSLQTRAASDPATLNVLYDSQNRIRSMALIHEKLYQSADLANIDFGEYLNSLASHLHRSYVSDGCLVQVKVNAARVRLSIDTAVPCGLIASELISNALKHAFVGRDSGTVCVEVRSNETGFVEMEVSDDGVGVTAELDPGKDSTLGMQLIKGLVRQLEGTLTVNGHPGASFVVAFQPRANNGNGNENGNGSGS